MTIPDYARAARLAYKTLLALHIESIPVDPLQILSFCRNTSIRTYEEITPLFGLSDPSHFRWYMMDNKDAMTIRRDMGGKAVYELLYDSHGSPSRRRFTLAHELGHIILKHSLEERFEEKEADFFASQLLAPAPVLEMLKEYGVPLDADTVADIFYISQSAAAIVCTQRPPCPDRSLCAEIQRQFAPWARSLATSFSLPASACRRIS